MSKLDNIPMGLNISRLTYLCLIVGIGAIIFTVIQYGIVYGIALSLIPIALTWVILSINNPRISLFALVVVNYLCMGVVRYVPELKGGLIVDLFVGWSLLSLVIWGMVNRIKWRKVSNPLTWSVMAWVVYCTIELFNPIAVSTAAWFATIRGIALYFLFVSILVPLVFDRVKDIKIFLNIWSVLTLMAVAKALMQKFYGFDVAEKTWLFQDNGASTHIIRSGIRYFSFFTDAANFGSGMGLSMVVFSICAIYIKKLRYYYLLVALAAGYAMIISGTRGALAVPFAGYFIYLILSKKVKFFVTGIIVMISVFFFLKYTTIGNSNNYLRRMRSAFNIEDASFQVRLNNQQLLREHLEDKPFGVGIGLGGIKAANFAPNEYASQIPTDSWFVMIWVETGIVGLILHVLMLLYIIIYGSYITMFRIRSPQLQGILASFVAGTVGICVASYGNEVLGQFPNAFIVYIIITFVFAGRYLDNELEENNGYGLS